MAYNHKKRLQKNAEASPQNREQALQEYNKDWSNSLPKSIPNYNGLLNDTRGEGASNPDQTIEALMDKPRKEASEADGRTTEGQLDKRDSYQVHRDAEHYDKSPMPPINALSGASDARFHQDYAKASKGGDARFLDRDPGSQMDGTKTKVVKNVPDSGSQIQNSPSRFSSGEDKAVFATLLDSDRILFDIYYKAASENREMTEQEKQIEAKISADKIAVLAKVAQQQPPMPPPVPHAPSQKTAPGQQTVPGLPGAPQNQVPPSDPKHPHGDVNSEFFPQPEGQDDSHMDEAMIDHLLGITPRGGVGGEDLANPGFANIHDQERQEIEFDPMDSEDGLPQHGNHQPRF